MAGTKTNAGNFFEDFRYGQIIPHATPRTVTDGDVALYTALYGSRFAVQSADTFAKAIGYPRAPLDDLLTFHVVFGKTTPDISLNAIANLGYAACRFLKPVYPGDTLSSVSEVIGLKENSNGETGTVYVRSTGRNQDGLVVLEYCRWVMVRKRDKASPPPPRPSCRSSPIASSRRTWRWRSRRSMSANTISRSRVRRIAGATTRRAKRSTTSTA